MICHLQHEIMSMRLDRFKLSLEMVVLRVSPGVSGHGWHRLGVASKPTMFFSHLAAKGSLHE